MAQACKRFRKVSSHKTFRVIARETATVLTRSLVERARDANNAAKRSIGALRQVYYAEKARCLRRAIELSPDDFWLSDYDPATGIVGVSSTYWVRLHVPLASLDGLRCGNWANMLGWAKEQM